MFLPTLITEGIWICICLTTDTLQPIFHVVNFTHGAALVLENHGYERPWGYYVFIFFILNCDAKSSEMFDDH
jgi:hypothetical protein